MDGITTATSDFGIIDPQQGCNFIKFKKVSVCKHDNTFFFLALHSARLMPPFAGILSRHNQESLNHAAIFYTSHTV